MLFANNIFNASGRGCEIVCSALFEMASKTTAKIHFSKRMKPYNWSEFSLVCGEFSIIVKASSELEEAIKMAFVLLEVDVLDQTVPQRH